MRSSIRLWFAPIIVVLLVVAALPAEPLAFELTFSPRLRPEPFTGRVILFLSDVEGSESPRTEHRWGSRQPVFSQDVIDWKPGAPLRITNPNGFPFPLDELPAGNYAVQAVMHVNHDLPHSGRAPGNLYSKTKRLDLNPGNSGTVRLELRRRVKSEDRAAGLARTKIVEVNSDRLTRFHGRPILHRAAVVLPKEYDEQPDAKFPAIYVIHGFGGDHLQSAMMAAMYGKPSCPFIRIGLDASCPLGHHAFADSDNNGPRGTALVEELIPHLENEFRLIPDPSARFLTGHSSGGWSSLWLQVAYPDFFGGVWSTSPDPVTFADFCGINLYDPKSNFFTDAEGERRPIMRTRGRIEMWLDDFARMEDVIGPGGQINSFEAVFSPRGPGGNPRLLFDRKTGKLDRQTVEAWRKYDIVEKLRREWDTLGPKLAGKLTIIVGEEDNFYLAGAVHRLQDALAELGSDARVIIEPGKDHGSIMFTKPFRNMYREMSDRWAATTQPADTADR